MGAKNLLKRWYEAFSTTCLTSSQDSGSESGSESGRKENMSLSFNEFCLMTQKHLCEKYVHKDDGQKWENHARSAFKASKAASAMLHAARDNFETQGSPTSPQKVDLRTAGVAIKNANLFGRHDFVADRG